MGADLHYTQRGGDVTFHGPHQAVFYPIISLREIGLGAREYVGKLESTMIELASLHGVEARAGQKGETGVWVGQRKIGAIGVRISSGITSHGLAFNIHPDMNYFKYIVPCAGFLRLSVWGLIHHLSGDPFFGDVISLVEDFVGEWDMGGVFALMPIRGFRDYQTTEVV